MHKKTATGRNTRPLSAAISAALSLAAGAAHADPHGGVVTQGSATISTPSANLTRIDQTSHSVSIDWQSFDVSANERVNFNQPSANSVALNRILSQDPSQIFGSINANGRVFLLNPNGIVFGASARINVGSLVASSLDLTGSDGDRFSFGTSAARSGAIVNDGQITAASGGSVTLLGGSVLNNGLIVADYGSVNLGAGRTATLDFSGDGLMRFQVDDALLASDAAAAVSNNGEILADGGQVVLTARTANDVIASAVNNTGLVRAARIDNTGGVIRLLGPQGSVSNSGTLDASGVNGTGGEVSVLGNEVALGSTSVVDVSGATGGGTAFIGGGFAGADPQMLNAQRTDVAAGAVIRADSTESGNAGRVAVWADDTTTFDGDIFARALGASGNGGFAEVSGQRNLRIGGHAALTSAHGVAGSLLLDPGQINIVNGGNSPPGSDNEVNDAWIISQLGMSGLVTISTSNYGNGAPPTLTVDSDASIVWNSASTLALTAGSSISFEAGSVVRSTNSNGSLTVNAGAGVDFGGTLELGGNLTVDAGGDIAQSSALQVGGSASFDAGTHAITLDQDNAITGRVALAGGAVTFNNTLATELDNVTADSLSVTSGGVLTQSSTITTTGLASFTTLNDPGAVISLNGANSFGSLEASVRNANNSANANASIAISESNDTTLAGNLRTAANQAVTITSAGNITQSGALVAAGNVTLTAGGAAPAITLQSGTNAVTGTIGFNADTVAFVNGGATELGTSTVGSSLDVTSGGDITQSGVLSAADVTLSAAGQDIELNGANQITGDIAITGHDVSLRSTAATLQASTVSGDLSVTTTSGAIVQSGAVTVTGGAAFDSAAAVAINNTLSASTLDVTAHGAISAPGAITTAGLADFTTLSNGSAAITLNAGNQFGSVAASVRNAGNTGNGSAGISINEIGDTALAGNLRTAAGQTVMVTSTGNITQSGALSAAGNVSLTAGGTGSITLMTGTNQLSGTVSLDAVSASLTNGTATRLGTSTIDNNLTVTSSGAITQIAALSVGGAASFTTLNDAGAAITLNADNSFGSVAASVRNAGNSANANANISIFENNDTTLAGNLRTAANQTVTILSAGNITQSGALVAAGDLTLIANGGAINLQSATNAVTGSIGFNTGTVAFVNNGATDLLASSVVGDLTVESSGSITQSGALTVGAAASFTSGNNQSITLGANNTFNGTTTFAASIGGTLNNVTVVDTNALALQSMTLAGNLTASGASISTDAITVGNNLQLTATAAGIGQTGPLIVNGTSTFDAGGQTIALSQNNQLTGAVAFNGSSVTLNNNRATVLGAGSANILNITSNGDITQNDAMNVVGDATFAAQSGQSIVLDQDNTFGGAVNFVGTGLDTITVHDLTALDLKTLDVATLDVTAAGITQSGVLTVSGDSSFDAGTQNVTLDQSNQLKGTVALTGGSVTLNNAWTTDLGTGSTSTLNIASTGDITQSGILAVSGNSSFDAGSLSIALDQNNQFQGAIALTGGSVTLNNARATNLGAVSATTLDVTSTGALTQSGILTVTDTSNFAAGTDDITLTQDNQLTGAVALTGDDVTLNNNRATLLGAGSADTLNITSNGTITQNAALNVTGDSTFAAQAGQSILLGQSNTFTGDVSFTGSGLDTITVHDLTALELHTMDVGTLNVTAAGITQDGILTVGSGSNFDAGSQNITLGQDNLLTGAVALTGNTVTLTNAQATTLGSGSAAELSVTSDGTITQSGSLAIGGDLHLTASSGDITQSAALNVTGDSVFAAGGNISLTQANALTGDVTFNATNAALTNTLATTLTTSTLDTLVLNSAGAVGQTGALNVANTATIAAAGQTVTLQNSSNAFNGPVAITAANASLTNATATNLGASSLSGDLTVNSTGALSQSGAVSAGGNTTINAAGVTLGTLGTNTLAITSSGTISQTGPVTVAGTTSLTAAGQNVTLGNTGNAFNGAITISAANASLTNSLATTLQPVTLAGNLTVNSTGALTQNGALNVGGVATLNSGAGVSLNTIDAGTLAITAGGTVSQSGAATIAGNTTIAAAGHDVQLANAANTFSGTVAVTGANVTLRDSDALTLGASTVSGNLQATSVGGTIAQAGTLNVGGNSIFTAADGQSILLNDTANSFGTGLSLASSGTLDDVSLAAATSLNLLGLNISGDLDVVSAGAVTQSGALVVGGQATFRTLNAGNDIALAGANQFGSVSATGAGGVSITQGVGDLNLRQVTATGNARLEASNGSIVDDATDAAAASVSAAGVELHAQNSIGTVTDLLTRQGTAIGVDTHGGPLIAQVANSTGQISLDIASGSNPAANPGAIAAGGAGRLLIQSGGDLSLNSFNAAIGGFTEIGFSAEGVLSMPGQQSDLISGPLTTLSLHGGTDIARADRTFNLAADQLVFTSGAQGGDVTLNVAANRIDATLGGTANLSIVDADALTLGNIAAGGNVAIRAGEILDDGDTGATTFVHAGNTLSLSAATNIGREDGSGGGRVDTQAASVSLGTDAGSAFIAHDGNVQLSGNVHGSANVIAPSGNIAVNGTLNTSDALTLVAGTSGNIVLTGSAQSGSTATLTAANGVISDGNDAATHLSAQSAILTANAIGSQANHLNIAVSTLSATAADGVYVAAAGNAQLGAIAGQTVSLRADGSLLDDGNDATRIVAQQVDLSAAAIGAGNNAIDTTTATLFAAASNGGIHIAQDGNVVVGQVAATGGDVTLTASGTISDDGDSATRISGNAITLNAAALGADDALLGTQATSLTATAPGGIYIDEADALQLNAITASAGDVVIRANGALTNDGNDATRVGGVTVTLTGTSIGTSDNRVDTAAAIFNANASNGGVFVAEQDNVRLHDVRSSGTGNTVDLRTANNGNIVVETLVTQGGGVNLTAGGTGSLDVAGNIESNNGVINLISGNALAAPGLDSGTGSVTLHTVNDLNVGTIAAGQVSITSDAGSITLGTIDATGGSVSITATNGAISDNADTSITANSATFAARTIGSADNPLNVAIDTLTATASAGGIFIDDTTGLTLTSLAAAGPVSLRSAGNFTQNGALSANGDISVLARGIEMLATATTTSAGGNILYSADAGNIGLARVDAGNGRALLIAAHNIYNSLDSGAGLSNVSGSMLELRAGGLDGSAGEIGIAGAPISLATTGGAGQTIFLIVPAIEGIQTSTPNVNFAGSPASLLLKGYTGTGALLFDTATAFNADTIILGNETIVPLRNGRVAVNSDSLSAAKQALSSGVISRVNIDWAAFDPNVSLFGTLDPSIRLPADQIDELAPVAELIPAGTQLLVSRDGWRLKPEI